MSIYWQMPSLESICVNGFHNIVTNGRNVASTLHLHSVVFDIIYGSWMMIDILSIVLVSFEEICLQISETIHSNGQVRMLAIGCLVKKSLAP